MMYFSVKDSQGLTCTKPKKMEYAQNFRDTSTNVSLTHSLAKITTLKHGFSPCLISLAEPPSLFLTPSYLNNPEKDRFHH